MGLANLDPDRVVSGGTVRHGWSVLSRLQLSTRIGGSNRKRVRAGNGGPLVFPLPPGIRTNGLGKLSRQPGALVNLHLDSRDARVLRPGGVLLVVRDPVTATPA